jgi:ubiquinone biosynthesis protein COQ9
MTARRKKPGGDAQSKEAVTNVVVARAGAEGFSDVLLARLGRELDIEKPELARLFPSGVASVIEVWSGFTDAGMEKKLQKLELKSMKVRERIRTAVKTRLDILKPNKDAARRAAAFLSLPPNLPLAAKLLYRTVDSMWRAAGDTSTDFNFYTKRGILAGVWSSTLFCWFNDKSDDERETDAFLAARIENVMQIERVKAELGKGLSRIFAQTTAHRSSK